MNDFFAKDFQKKIGDKVVTFKELSALDCFKFYEKNKDFKFTILDKDITSYLSDSAPKIVGENFQGIKELIFLSSKGSLSHAEIDEISTAEFISLGIDCLVLNTSFFLTTMQESQNKVLKAITQAAQAGGKQS